MANKRAKNCKHIFMVPTPDGRDTVGKCRKCNTKRVMYNSVIQQDYKTWQSNRVKSAVVEISPTSEDTPKSA